MKTFRYRLKSRHLPSLTEMAISVDFVWNYCNETSLEYINKKEKWLSNVDLFHLTRGCSRELRLNAQTIQAICIEYVYRRNQYKRKKLSWRSRKRSLGWIPMNRQAFSVYNDILRFDGKEFRFWKSRPFTGEIKNGNLSQDSKGNWYLNLVCESPSAYPFKSGGEVGIDLGLKTIATLSDGTKLGRDNITAKYAGKLAMAQRARKKRLVTNIHAKIKNSRKDWNHKRTTELVNKYDRIIVGDVSPSKLKKTRMAKSVSDAAWYSFKTMLAYKAIALGVEYKEVKENFSSVTCSNCLQRTGPSGLSALGVREWKCSCGSLHDRDVNAAKNILRFGHESLKGSIDADVNK